ncbi:aminotransferase class IV [Chloroflexota bacterium]
MPRSHVWRVSDPSKSSKIEAVKIDGRSSTFHDFSSRFPDGVFTTFRTFEHNKIVRLESHFRRLEESAHLLNKPIKLNYSLIKDALREVVELSKEQDLRIRLTINLDSDPTAIYISKEQLVTPSLEDYEKGVITVTQDAIRINPKAKLTAFLQTAEIIRGENPNNVNEVLLVNIDDQILEGLSSNFFAVKQGEIWTEEAQVLSGTVRSVVLELAEKSGIQVHRSAIFISEIENLEEAFLTSTSRMVLPIHKIDSTIVNTGKPGPITKELRGLYQQEVQSVMVEI